MLVLIEVQRPQNTPANKVKLYMTVLCEVDQCLKTPQGIVFELFAKNVIQPNLNQIFNTLVKIKTLLLIKRKRSSHQTNYNQSQVNS